MYGKCYYIYLKVWKWYKCSLKPYETNTNTKSTSLGTSFLIFIMDTLTCHWPKCQFDLNTKDCECIFSIWSPGKTRAVTKPHWCECQYELLSSQFSGTNRPHLTSTFLTSMRKLAISLLQKSIASISALYTAELCQEYVRQINIKTSFAHTSPISSPWQALLFVAYASNCWFYRTTKTAVLDFSQLYLCSDSTEGNKTSRRNVKLENFGERSS